MFTHPDEDWYSEDIEDAKTFGTNVITYISLNNKVKMSVFDSKGGKNPKGPRYDDNLDVVDMWSYSCKTPMNSDQYEDFRNKKKVVFKN